MGSRRANESGPEGINFEGPESEEVGLNGELQLAAGHCPDASIVGYRGSDHAAAARTGEGSRVSGAPGVRRCGAGRVHRTRTRWTGNLYQLYLELGGDGCSSRTRVSTSRCTGDIEANPATGQLTTKFLENPQAPFSELKIDLNGGPRAPLDNPAVCGPAVDDGGLHAVERAGDHPGRAVDGGYAGRDTVLVLRRGRLRAARRVCSPGFSAGTVTPQAGQFSAFTLNLSRQDREQYRRRASRSTPPRVCWGCSRASRCAENPQADERALSGSRRRSGRRRVASGAGSHPFEIEGNVYLTGRL